MTYLQIVNNVLRRMREDEVTSVNQNTYSKMVGDFVNDAYRLVSDAWDWSGFRTTISIPTVDDTSSYSLAGTGSNVTELSFTNTTSDRFLQYKPNSWMRQTLLSGDPKKGSPQYYTYDGVDSSGDTKVKVYPVPDGVYNLEYYCVLRPQELTTDSQVVLVPSSPITQLAIAMLARERGETGGTSTAEYFVIAEKYLSDAISHDAHKHPEELIWKYI